MMIAMKFVCESYVVFFFSFHRITYFGVKKVWLPDIQIGNVVCPRKFDVTKNIMKKNPTHTEFVWLFMNDQR